MSESNPPDDPQNQRPEEIELERAQEMGLALREDAFDVGGQTLDLTKCEKRRTTALMMAINYYLNSVVKDAAMYDALRRDGKTLPSMNVDHCVDIAVKFDAFIATGAPLALTVDPDEDPGNQENSGRASGSAAS
jgi:hypothetical protein